MEGNGADFGCGAAAGARGQTGVSPLNHSKIESDKNNIFSLLFTNKFTFRDDNIVNTFVIGPACGVKNQGNIDLS